MTWVCLGHDILDPLDRSEGVSYIADHAAEAASPPTGAHTAGASWAIQGWNGDDAMTTINLETITQAVREALSHRDSRRDALAERIRSLAEQAMSAARVRSIDLPDPDGDRTRETGTIEYRTPVGDCSQWSNRIDHPGHRGEPCLMFDAFGEAGWRSLGPVPDVGFFDGRNIQYQHGPSRERETNVRILPATVGQLRTVARVLPCVLAELLVEALDRADRESAEADSAIEEL